MLINQSVSVGDTVTIKLINGDEVLARLVDETETHWLVTKPMSLTATPNGLGLIPYAVTMDLDKNIPIAKSAIAAIGITVSHFMIQYTESTTNIKLL